MNFGSRRGGFVAVNPDTGATVSVWPTHSKIARKLLKEQGEQ